MDDQERDKTLNRLAIAIDRVFQKPGRLIWRGLLIGFASGVGGILGAAFIILVLGYLVSHFGGIPLIGDFLQRIGNAVPSN